MRRYFMRRNAPVWLPALVFLRDFLAWQYIFSFEPGITEQAIFRGKLFMLPGFPRCWQLLADADQSCSCLGVGLLLRRSARIPISN